MGALGFTIIDPVVVAVVIMSATYATYRGFVSESLSIFAWAAAAFTTLFFGPRFAPYTRELVSSPLLGVLLGYAVIFLVVLIPLSFVSYRFSETVKNSPVSTLDRALGFSFGVVRGLAIVGLAYIAFSYMISVRNQPDWIANARLLPVIQGSSEVLLSLVPDQHTNRANVAQTDETAAPAPKTAAAPAPPPAAAALTPPIPQPRPAVARQKTAHKTYGIRERRELDRLIDATASGGSDKP
jgi:membrane protein required for colicin V production